jgi:hypothetical protein
MVGPNILVDIGFDPAILTLVTVGAPMQPTATVGNPNIRQVLALIDTGAMDSCIDIGH